MTRRGIPHVGITSGKGRHPCSGSHPAAEYDGVVLTVGQLPGESVHVSGPLGQHHAMTTETHCLLDTVDNVRKRAVVGDEVSVDRGHSARTAGIGDSVVPVGRVVNNEPALGCRDDALRGAAAQSVAPPS